MSRAEKLERFVVQRQIESAPGNRAVWTSARLGYETAKNATMSRAEEFVLAQVTASPRHLTTTDLRRATDGTGIRFEAIQKALSTLQLRGSIDYEPAPRNAKLWFPTASSETASAA